MTWRDGPVRCVEQSSGTKGLGCLTPSARWWLFSDGSSEELSVRVRELEETESTITVNGIEYRAV